MKIEKINLNKIKVTFSPEDLIEHNITPEAVRENAPSMQKVLTMIVHRAETEIGFDGQDARLMVEAIPGEGDSMVMYITRLETEDEVRDALKMAKRKLRLKVDSNDENREKLVCISFSDFEDAVNLGKFLPDENGGELYFYENSYHIVICGNASLFLSEFGKSVSDEKTCSLLRERGKLISNDALGTLRKYFM